MPTTTPSRGISDLRLALIEMTFFYLAATSVAGQGSKDSTLLLLVLFLYLGNKFKAR